MSDQEPTDDEILALAQSIKAEKGLPLAEAMDEAIRRLTRRGDDIDCTFTLTVQLKPRVARFYRKEFAGHPTLSVEERLSKFVEMKLNEIRGQALARSRADPDIQEGQANTLRRSAFIEKTAGL